MYINKRSTYKLNIVDGLDAFQTFCQTLNSPSDDPPGTVPKRSILRSPLISIGMGCACADEGAETEFKSVRMAYE